MEAPGLGLELRLGLPCMAAKKTTTAAKSTEKKRAFWEINGEENDSSTTTTENSLKSGGGGGGSLTKSTVNNQVVVGWPPVCSYRKKNSFNGRENKSKTYVKVSMDGAPILRKIDLASFNDYSQLTIALQKLFHCFQGNNNGEELKDGTENNEYVPIYEDKDGDWMLVGDVPWEMFTESCKRLRIMKNADAKGIGLNVKSFLKLITNNVG